MAKKHPITIYIPKPCQENWDSMTANEQGRHCGSCNKTVLDFSLYTDKELFEFFKKANGRVCGRINNYQINRPILITEQTNHSFFHKLFVGTALASWLGLASSANAQSNNTTVQKEQSSPKKIIGHMNTSQTDTTEKSCEVKGTVYDSALGAKEPIPFANVVVRTKDSLDIGGAVSDIDGKFKISIPSEFFNKKLRLTCIYVGYKDKVIEFIVKQNSISQNIQMASAEVKLMGALMIIEPPQALDSREDVTTYHPGDSPTLPPRSHH